MSTGEWILLQMGKNLLARARDILIAVLGWPLPKPVCWDYNPNDKHLLCWLNIQVVPTPWYFLSQKTFHCSAAIKHNRKLLFFFLLLSDLERSCDLDSPAVWRFWPSVQNSMHSWGVSYSGNAVEQCTLNCSQKKTLRISENNGIMADNLWQHKHCKIRMYIYLK